LRPRCENTFLFFNIKKFALVFIDFISVYGSFDFPERILLDIYRSGVYILFFVPFFLRKARAK
jgi:hypothetical protein